MVSSADWEIHLDDSFLIIDLGKTFKTSKFTKLFKDVFFAKKQAKWNDKLGKLGSLAVVG